MRIRWIGTALILILSSGSPAPAATPTKLETLRSAYEGAMKTIDADSRQKIAAWPIDYMKAVKTLQMTMQKAGHLDGWQACQKEIDRFQGDRAVTTQSLISEPPELRAIQDRFLDAGPRLVLEKNKAIVALAEKYIVYLNELQKELTIANRINEALAANAEIKTVKADSRVTAAEFSIAEYLAAHPAPVATAPETAPPAAVVKENEKPPPQGVITSPLVATSDGVKVYGPGEQPDSPSDLKFKRLNLKPARNIQADASVLASASLAEIPKVTEKRMEVFGSTIAQKRTETSHYLRLSLRLGGMNTELPNAAVAIQFFASDYGQTGGKVIPGQIGAIFVNLPRLAGDTIWIDCPPILSAVTEIDQKAPGRTGQENRRGQDFQGITITVFDKPDNTIAQFASDKKLNDLAMSRLPVIAPNAPQTDALLETLRKTRDAYREHPRDPVLRKAFHDARGAYRDATGRPGFGDDN